MANEKNNNVETVEVEATVNDSQETPAPSDVLDENGEKEIEVKPVSVFSKIGTTIDAGLTRGKKLIKKHGKKIAVGAGVIGGTIAIGAAAQALSDLDKQLGASSPESDPSYPDPRIDYERAEQVMIEAHNAEIDRQLAELESPAEEIGAEA